MAESGPVRDPAALGQGEVRRFSVFSFRSGRFEGNSSWLSAPMANFFGVHEVGNQDITSHALTSGIIGLEILRLARSIDHGAKSFGGGPGH